MKEVLLISGLMLAVAVLIGIVGAFLMAQVPLFFCRLGYHRWETPPFLHLFAMFPQHRDYQQCTRIGCWKTRDIQPNS